MEDIEGAGGVEAAVASEFEAFGEDGAMEPEDEVEDELHAGAGAGGAGVKKLGADGEEDGFGAGEGGWVGSADDEGFAGRDLTAGAAEGGIEVGDVLGGLGGGGGFDGGRVSGGGVDDHLDGAFESREDGGDFGGTGKAEKDAATGGGDGAYGIEADDAGRLRGGMGVVAVDGVPRREETGGEGGASEAEGNFG